MGFSFIASTLGRSHGQLGNLWYDCILLDNAISENEIRYLSALRDDVALIVADMESPENPPNLNEKFTIAQLNEALRNFFEHWSDRSADSPYSRLTSAQ
jgi:hypothetical protein